VGILRRDEMDRERLMIKETDGHRNVIFVPYVKGCPFHPKSKEEVGDKAMELMTPHFGEKRAKEVIDMVITIDSLPAVVVF